MRTTLSAPRPHVGAATPPGRALVVEDDPVLAETLRDLLEEEGYAVAVHRNGHEALAALGDPPDLALVDLLLPGLNGVEVCRWLKTDPRTRQVPVIFITAASPEFLAGWLDGCPCDAVLHKPFGLDALQETLARCQLRPGAND